MLVSAEIKRIKNKSDEKQIAKYARDKKKKCRIHRIQPGRRMNHFPQIDPLLAPLRVIRTDVFSLSMITLENGLLHLLFWIVFIVHLLISLFASARREQSCKLCIVKAWNIHSPQEVVIDVGHSPRNLQNDATEYLLKK